MTAITVFRPRGFALALYLLVGLAVVAQGLATAAYFTWYDAPEYPFGPILLALSGFMVVLGLWFSVNAVRRLRDPDPPIVIGPSGLHDRVISERPVPWRSVSNISLFNAGRGGLIVVFDIAPDALTASGVRRRARVAARINGTFGYRYRLNHMGTDANPARLVAAIRPYAPIKGAAEHGL